MVAKNKHHIRKEHGLTPSGMGFPRDSSISSRRIITMKMRQNLRHFGTKRVKNVMIISVNVIHINFFRIFLQF